MAEVKVTMMLKDLVELMESAGMCPKCKRSILLDNVWYTRMDDSQRIRTIIRDAVKDGTVHIVQ